ncbi:MAG TPA: sigma-54 dependent transcriptional regulator [Candidatus Methylacidiphilales bacterium]|jgi:two-component system nitrogen regulation response regulator GlnG|nr:sigma-54 dependent transcriptional regulator [Candidatus Methylacidiphilales bacterium]
MSSGAHGHHSSPVKKHAEPAPTPAAEGRQSVLIIDDEKDVHYSFRRLLEKEPLEIHSAESGDEGIKLAKKHAPDLIVMDIRMGQQSGLDTLKELRQMNPKQVVVMMTAYGTSQTAIEAMKRGAYDYVLKPFDIPQLKVLLFEALSAARAMKQIVAFPTKLNADESNQTIVGNSTAMQQVYKLIGQVASTSTTILITGESGTGKELVARAIFQNGARANKPFIAINCAAIPENLLESELFGHEKGAFTGALAQRIGKFEQCDGGTIFLDEIGDMPMTTQTKILRVLQEGEVSRVGNNASIKVDVRIIAATNKDLWQAVQRKEFREDLFYRLNVVRLNLPPLRDRQTDIPILVAYFINKFRLKQPTGPSQIADDAMAAIQRFPWPGNVRQLENCIQRAMVLASGNTITLANLPEEIAHGAHVPVSTPLAADTHKSAHAGAPAPGAEHAGPEAGKAALSHAVEVLFNFARQDKQFKLLPAAERELIVRALAETSGNQVQAAKLLGVTRATLRKRVDKFGIQKRMAID